MRLASYNLENLFLRARALNGDTWAEGREVLKAQADLNRILGKSIYTAADKTKVITLLKQLGLEKSDESKCHPEAEPRPSGQAAEIEADRDRCQRARRLDRLGRTDARRSQ